MKKLIRLLLFIFLILLVGCSTSKENVDSNSEKPQSNETPAVTDNEPQVEEILHHAEIEIENYGLIKVELDGTNAPITVSNFIELAKSGFYDGLTFHRIINGFMMQGGDPDGTGTGGSGTNIKGEFALNGVDNPLSHTRGAISMARSNDFDSASSQFFIVHKDYPSLDGQYAAFGYVTEGLDVLDRICSETPVTDNNGTVQKANQPVIISVKIID